MNALYPELLSLIFTHVVYDSNSSNLDFVSPSINGGPLLLGRVCQRWREVTRRTPGLWCRMRVPVVFERRGDGEDIRDMEEVREGARERRLNDWTIATSPILPDPSPFLHRHHRLPSNPSSTTTSPTFPIPSILTWLANSKSLPVHLHFTWPHHPPSNISDLLDALNDAGIMGWGGRCADLALTMPPEGAVGVCQRAWGSINEYPGQGEGTWTLQRLQLDISSDEAFNVFELGWDLIRSVKELEVNRRVYYPLFPDLGPGLFSSASTSSSTSTAGPTLRALSLNSLTGAGEFYRILRLFPLMEKLRVELFADLDLEETTRERRRRRRSLRMLGEASYNLDLVFGEGGNGRREMREESRDFMVTHDHIRDFRLGIASISWSVLDHIQLPALEKLHVYATPRERLVGCLGDMLRRSARARGMPGREGERGTRLRELKLRLNAIEPDDLVECLRYTPDLEVLSVWLVRFDEVIIDALTITPTQHGGLGLARKMEVLEFMDWGHERTTTRLSALAKMIQSRHGMLKQVIIRGDEPLARRLRMHPELRESLSGGLVVRLGNNVENWE